MPLSNTTFRTSSNACNGRFDISCIHQAFFATSLVENSVDTMGCTGSRTPQGFGEYSVTWVMGTGWEMQVTNYNANGY